MEPNGIREIPKDDLVLKIACFWFDVKLTECRQGEYIVSACKCFSRDSPIFADHVRPYIMKIGTRHQAAGLLSEFFLCSPFLCIKRRISRMTVPFRGNQLTTKAKCPSPSLVKTFNSKQWPKLFKSISEFTHLKHFETCKAYCETV